MRAIRNFVTKVAVAIVAMALASISVTPILLAKADAAWMNYQTSPSHLKIKANIDIQYDVQQIHFGITDEDPGRLYFYLNFVKPVLANQFADGMGSYANVSLDTNGDNKPDYAMQTTPNLPYDGNLIHPGVFIDKTSGSDVISSKCDVQTFTDLTKQVDWIGFSILKACLPFNSNVGVLGYSVLDPKNKNQFDQVPEAPWNLIFPGAPTSTVATFPIANSSTDLPAAPGLGSNSIVTPASSPDNLVSLAASETKSIVTINCLNTAGSGWSARVNLSTTMLNAGYRSYIITNEHVIKDCLASRAVTVILSEQTSLSGYLWAWDEVNDVAGIAMRTDIPALPFEGVAPEQGWWTGVEGSPLGFPGVLTEGIISSVNLKGFLATTTAHINPGNSGGPAFDRVGRVIGIATAKYVDAEGFGIIHGAPMLCDKVIKCTSTASIWTVNSDSGSNTTTELNQNLASQTEALHAAGQLLLEGAKNVLAHSTEQLTLATQDYPSAKSDLLKFLALAPKIPAPNADALEEVDEISAFANQVTSYEKLVKAKLTSLEASDPVVVVKPIIAASPTPKPTVKTTAKPTPKPTVKLKTITCLKGTSVKKVTGTTPKCPTGYKIKA